MYKITCDGYPLLDTRFDDFIVKNPKVKLEVNTVGEGSFEIFSNHPNFDKLKMLKSIFVVSDEYGIVFCGRMTELSEDFWNGKAVDLEGVLGFFNDSIVRPFDFPNDFLNDTGYKTALSRGNVVEFFLGWLIENHNSQVEDFQRFELGNVTVSDPNNFITRSDSNYKRTWEILKEKLFDSSLGGKLCIRYEPDGNFIDYLSEFTEANTQGIEYGSNLLDLMHDTSAAATYSAIIPLGAKKGADENSRRLTLDGFVDEDIDDDLVLSGDTIYSRSAVATYGWIYAPPEETTWDDITNPFNLRNTGAEWLKYKGIRFSDAVELTAADLHFSDSEIRSFRIYKKIPVYSAPHNVLSNYDLAKLDLDLMNPQNTKITVGETRLTLTDLNAKSQNTIKNIKNEFEAKLASLNQNLATYSVTNILANCMNSNATSTVKEGATYSATLTATNGYLIDSVTVTMGGEDITSFVFTETYGTIYIASVTGDIVITARYSPPAKTYTVTYNLSSMHTSSNESTSVKDGDSYSTAIWYNGSVFVGTVTVTMGGIDITDSVTNITSMNATITIPVVTGDVVITAVAE